MKSIEEQQELKNAFYRHDTQKYRVALNKFIDEMYTSFLAGADKNADYSLELFKTGNYRVLKGRNLGGHVRGRGWIMPLWIVNASQANEELNKELSYSRGTQEMR